MIECAMELEPRSNIELARPSDRPKMPEPPPVRLVAVEDVHLPAPAGVEVQLDSLYVGLLRFQRDPAHTTHPVYRSENFAIIFDVLEPPVEREDLRATGIEVPSLREFEQKLIDMEMEYQRQKGLTAGCDTLLLQDPAGNWVAVGEFRRVG